MIELNILNDQSELVPYNTPYFPIHTKKYWLSYYPNMSAISHWHDDIEFIIILRGTMHYFVNGQDYVLEEGQGIFINSKQLHYGYSADGTDCEFLCFVLHPSLLTATMQIKHDYIDAICIHSNYNFLILSPAITWHCAIIDHLKKIYTLCTKQEKSFELETLSHFFSLWHILYQNLNHKLANITPPSNNKQLITLHHMIGYIQNNYKNKITLQDIALSGNVCRSSCCEIFNSLLSMTPISYLTRFRLEKSLEYLPDASLSITEIALRCGFNSSSYFTELFRKELGLTPSQYRKKMSR